MHIDIVPNRGSRPTVLLRVSYREGKKVRKRTLANLSALPMEQVEAIRQILKGEKLAPVGGLFDIVESYHHGHVDAVLTAMRRLRFDSLIASRRCRERDLVVAMIAARVLEPHSKLATQRWWKTTTLPDSLDVSDADEDELYEAMDWLLVRQRKIERKLASRHLNEGSVVLYDLSSSYFEGQTCPLAALGHNRDGKKGKLQVNYGLLADGRGCPVAVSVFDGNTSDSTTLMPQVAKVREEFGLDEMVVVGDRGMICQKQIDELKEHEGVHWITALRTDKLRKMVQGGAIQMGLFDERNLFEFTHPEFPGERLIACRNAELARLRAHKRDDLLMATQRELEKVRSMVGSGRLTDAGAIGVRAGRVVNKYKVAKHFKLDIGDGRFSFRVDEAKVATEASLDGIYVIRTSLPKKRLDTADTVRTYKDLGQVERAFRSLKTMDLHVRPIHHRLENRVRAHILLAMLAYYVQWHMVEALRPLLFHDEDQEARGHRDPVAPARRSAKAEEKARSKRLADGSCVHSFRTLLKHLSQIVRNVCRAKTGTPDGVVFDVCTTANAKQQRALDLLRAIKL
jgi:transposase